MAELTPNRSFEPASLGLRLNFNVRPMKASL